MTPLFFQQTRRIISEETTFVSYLLRRKPVRLVEHFEGGKPWQRLLVL
jgi:hypothetical protein